MTDTLQKQCNSLKQQVEEVKEKICERAGKIVDTAKRKGQRALYKITQVTGMRKKQSGRNSSTVYERGRTEERIWCRAV